MYKRLKGDGCITVGEHKRSEKNVACGTVLCSIYLVLILSFPSTIVDCNFLYEFGVLSSQMAGRIRVIFVFSFTYKIMMPNAYIFSKSL